MTGQEDGFWYPLAVPTMGEEEISAVTAVLRSGHTTMGAKVAEFEEAFARTVGARHAVMVNSGSSADLLMAFALPTLGEVLIPAVTWPTHAWAWYMAGADVRLVDVDGLNTTADILADAISPSTVGVSLVHLMGVPCDMDAIAKVCDGLVITEDCCEALGAHYNGDHVGTFGEAASWSFFFSHHMTTMEGGMVTCGDADLADRLRTLRSHGWARHLDDPPKGLDPRYTFVDWGFNLRPTEVQAAIGLVQLQRLPELLAARQNNWADFSVALHNPDVYLFDYDEKANPGWFGLTFLCEHRDSLAAYLEANGVETRPILAGNLSRQPAFIRRGIRGDHFPGANLIHEQGLYVGLHPVRSDGAGRVAELINRWRP